MKILKIQMNLPYPFDLQFKRKFEIHPLGMTKKKYIKIFLCKNLEAAGRKGA